MTKNEMIQSLKQFQNETNTSVNFSLLYYLFNKFNISCIEAGLTNQAKNVIKECLLNSEIELTNIFKNAYTFKNDSESYIVLSPKHNVFDASNLSDDLERFLRTYFNNNVELEYIDHIQVFENGLFNDIYSISIVIPTSVLDQFLLDKIVFCQHNLEELIEASEHDKTILKFISDFKLHDIVFQLQYMKQSLSFKG
jgi:hypothetical protein